jgi:hypothetical protein
MSRIPAPSPPVIGGTPANHSGLQSGYDRVVVHSAVIPCEPGRARQLGEMNRSGSTGGSWHYSTDPAETFQCSFDRFICWHAPPNGRSIGIEMADWPKPVPTATAEMLSRLKRTWRWRGKNHRAMLDRTARLTAHLLLAEGLPLEYRTAKQLRARQKGWTTHRQVSLAFGQSSHWDPGFWPRRKFGRLVKKYAAEIRANHQKGNR